MKISRHLADDELIDSHLDENRQHLEATLAALADCTYAEADRPEEFWHKQRAQIRERIAQSETTSDGRTARLVPAIALALLVIAGILLHIGPQANYPQARLDPDHELLIQVERAVHSNGPEALEPAGFLFQEISRSDSISSRDYKRDHEN